MKVHHSSRPLGEKVIRFFVWYYCYCLVQLDSSLPTPSSIRTTSTSTNTRTLFVNAVITIVETHQTFANTIDTNYGRSLMTGYEYYSRLQMLSNNPSLCLSSDNDSSSSEKNYSIVIPSDQLPVTLLVAHRNTNSSSSSSSNTIVREEDCTLLEKIQYALTHIQPLGRVKYLIVATSDDDAEGEEEEEGVKKEKHHDRHPNHYNSDDRFINDIHHNNKYINFDAMQSALHEQQQQQQQETPNKRHGVRTSQTAHTPLRSFASLVDIRRSKKDDTNPNQRTDIPLYIIHVSIATYDELYSIVQRQSQNTMLEGGIQISVDNNRHSHRYYNGGGNEQNQTLLFTALIAFVTAGVCFFIILLCGSSDWDEEAAAHHAANGGQPHTRPTRQRLTREQVRNLFPIYRYDGQSKLYRIIAIPSPSPTVPSAAVPSDSLQQPLLSSSSTTDEQPLHHQQEVIDNMMLDVCSICLDEYEIHDKVRVLPCHHTFHSKCVGRWLSERSAVCPLCKEDLYVEPEPVESEQETTATDTNITNSTNTTNNDNNNNNGSTSPPVTTEESLPRFNHLWRRFLQQMEILPPTAVTSPATTTNATATTLEPNTNNNTTTNNHTDVEMPMDTTLMVESNQPSVATIPNTTTPTEVTTATNTRISSSWWSRMFPPSTTVVPVVQSTSSPPLVNEPHSLTEPLLQHQHDDVILEPTIGSSVETTITTNSNTLPLEATTIPMDNSDIVNDNVVPSEDSLRSSTTELLTDNTSADQITIIDADQRIEKCDTSDETTVVDMSGSAEVIDPLQNLSSTLQEYSV